MSDQPRPSGTIVDPGVRPATRAAPASNPTEESVGYARADLREALARIRATSEPRTLPEPDRAALEEVRALAASIDASMASIAVAATRQEERIERLERRLVALTVVAAILGVAVAVLALLLIVR